MRSSHTGPLMVTLKLVDLCSCSSTTVDFRALKYLEVFRSFLDHPVEKFKTLLDSYEACVLRLWRKHRPEGRNFNQLD